MNCKTILHEVHDIEEDVTMQCTPTKPKSLDQIAQVHLYTPQQMLELPVQCNYCTRRFKKPESLGGHVAKAHPQQSKVYAIKIQRRNQRAPERELLAKAKKMISD